MDAYSHPVEPSTRADISAEDAVGARRRLYGGKTTVTQVEVEEILAINRHAGQLSREWVELFLEAMTDFVVRQQTPPGYVSEETGRWLVEQMRLEPLLRDDEIALLIHIINVADKTPRGLSHYVAQRIASRVWADFKRTGDVSDQDIAQLRAVLYGTGSENNIEITRSEAELVLRLNAAFEGKPVNPSFTQFYVECVSSCLLFKSCWNADPTVVLHQSSWLTAPKPRLGTQVFDAAVFSAGVKEGIREIVHWDFDDHAYDRKLESNATMEDQADRVDSEKAQWLISHLRDATAQDSRELALLSYIQANALGVDPALMSRFPA